MVVNAWKMIQARADTEAEAERLAEIARGKQEGRQRRRFCWPRPWLARRG